MEITEMKMVCEFPPGTLRGNVTTTASVPSLARSVRTMPGVGKPYLVFLSIPSPAVTADFDMYPDYVVSSDPLVNEANINAMLANPPTDAVTF